MIYVIYTPTGLPVEWGSYQDMRELMEYYNVAYGQLYHLENKKGQRINVRGS